MHRGIRRLLALGAMGGIAMLSGCGGGGTAALQDQSPPTVDMVRATRAQQTNEVIVQALVYDDVEVSTVEVVATNGSLQTITRVMRREYANQYRADLPYDTLRVQVRARDSAGKEGRSGEVLVPPPSPPDF
ncbi:MAG: hypothetical protein HPY54_08745 [Chthonomonadetes bacterium]|nr:hypothetical protein [Chthonomonadetes bacterium]